jgi:membrane-bound ClpP family serine protease
MHKWEDRDHLVVGAEGRVIKALDPIGTVQVNSELWSASSNKTLSAGTPIIVLERNGLQLYVESSKDKREPTHEIENQDILTK